MEFVTVKQIKHLSEYTFSCDCGESLILCLRWTAQGNNKWTHVGWAQQGIKTSRLVLWEL